MERTLTMLIAERNENLRRALVEYVRYAHPAITVLQTASRAQMLALCRNCLPQLVLIDIALAHAGGITVVERIKAIHPESEVIVVSQGGAQEYVERAYAVGAWACIPESRLYQDLLPMIRSALARRGLQSHLQRT